MDFPAAFEFSKDIEATYPDLLVIGFRRVRPRDPESWAVDLMHRETEKMATVDEKDLLEARIAEISPD